GEDRTMKTTRTRVYESPKLRTKRLAGIPVPILAIIAISMVVAATIVALGPYSAPKSQTAMTIFVGVGSAAEPAYGGVELNLVYGSIDHVLIQAWQSGYSSSQVIHLVIRIGGGGYTSCTDVSNSLQDINGVQGQISMDNDPLATPAAVILTSGTFASGKCTLDTTATAKSFTVLTSLTYAA